VDRWTDPPVIPSLTLPEAPQIPAPVLGLPKADLPSYKPIVVPPSGLRPPPGIKGKGSEKEPSKSKPTLPKEAQIVEIPFTDIEVPMPTTTIMTTAATTAFISVAATLTATSLFKYIVMILKPVFKKTWNTITKKASSSNSSSLSGQQDSSQQATPE
jgi:hypothetical protein